MQRTRYFLFMILLAVSLLPACSAQPATQAPPAAVPTLTLQPGRGITSDEQELPLTEAEVPRVSREEAKAALDSGAAILVDVRSPDAFEESHVAGAISVPLGQIERDLTQVPLDTDQWIITYCT
ncbi:MAG TPA: rhodanese-like domain-containing protein [Anaerolineales bacterium]|nr:rhodanese-like domain-containing protein [Anaerolineales bacterium]